MVRNTKVEGFLLPSILLLKVFPASCLSLPSPVCYDDELTDGLFRTLYRLCSNFTHTCTIFVSLEKR